MWCRYVMHTPTLSIRNKLMLFTHTHDLHHACCIDRCGCCVVHLYAVQ